MIAQLTRGGKVITCLIEIHRRQKTWQEKTAVKGGRWDMGQFETAALIWVFSSLRSCLGSEFYEA